MIWRASSEHPPGLIHSAPCAAISSHIWWPYERIKESSALTGYSRQHLRYSRATRCPTRAKVVQGALALLGDSGGREALQSRMPGSANVDIRPHTSSCHVRVPKPKAGCVSGLTDDLLEHVFDFNDQVELIAMPPGKNNREKTVNAGAA